MAFIINVLDVINEIIIIPVAMATFILLIYITLYLRKRDPEVIRAKIFLHYYTFKKAFELLAVFAFVLIIHVSLLYVPNYFYSDPPLSLIELQHFFGLVLALVMLSFAYYVFKSIK